jgi:small subunit ribosomal protein S21
MNKFEKNNEGPQGTRVIVSNNDFGKALRRFKKKIAEEGILQELRQREYYESKGTKRRKAKEAAIRRYKRQRIKDQDS